MLFSVVEPERGHGVAFHRWYERDHFYAGVLSGPGVFAGRRWVATRPLKDLRYPSPSPLADDASAGSYAVTYWILDGEHDAFATWAVERVHALYAEGRMFPKARQIHTSFYSLRWSVSRDQDGVPAELTLDHPYAGLVALWIDRARGVDAQTLERWYRDEHLPALLPGTPAARCLAFEALPLPEGAPADTPQSPDAEGRVLQLYFLEADPRKCWDELFAPHGELLQSLGLGVVSLAAPFIPTIPGLDRYADELW